MLVRLRPAMVAPVRLSELVTVRVPIVELTTVDEPGRVRLPVMVRLEIVVVAKLARPETDRLVEVTLPAIRLVMFPFVMVLLVIVVVAKVFVPVKVLLPARVARVEVPVRELKARPVMVAPVTLRLVVMVAEPRLAVVIEELVIVVVAKVLVPVKVLLFAR